MRQAEPSRPLQADMGGGLLRSSGACCGGPMWKPPAARMPLLATGGAIQPYRCAANSGCGGSNSTGAGSNILELGKRDRAGILPGGSKNMTNPDGLSVRKTGRPPTPHGKAADADAWPRSDPERKMAEDDGGWRQTEEEETWSMPLQNRPRFSPNDGPGDVGFPDSSPDTAPRQTGKSPTKTQCPESTQNGSGPKLKDAER